MQLQINGTPQTVPDDFNVSRLLNYLNLTDCKLAVEINRKIVPAGDYPDTALSANDCIEIIHAVGGG